MFSVRQVGATPLTMASQEGHNDVVQMLLERGAHVDHPTKVPALQLIICYGMHNSLLTPTG